MTQRREPGLSLPLLLRRSLFHRRGRTLAELIALTVSAAVATTLLTLYASLDLKLHHQFRTFGANIIVTSQVEHNGAGPSSLPPDALAVAQQIAGPDGHVAPFAYAIAQMETGAPIVVAGADLRSVRAMNSWWQVNRWPQDEHSTGKDLLPVLTGIRAEEALGKGIFTLSYDGKPIRLETAGTLRTGDAEDSRIYLPLAAFERWTGVSATTLEIQASGDAHAIQAVVAQLQRALPGMNVRPVHQLVDAEANVVSRTRSLMFGCLILISLTIAVCVLATLTASVLERRRDFAVMKALGATQHHMNALFLLEAVALALGGLVAGYILGCAAAWLIGEWNFHTTIFPLWRIVPQVALLNLIVAAVAAAIPMRILRRLEPATLLRGE